ncbi:MAG: hypothetical protein HQK91_14245 [Nitrospirae bacterium]|nr:hypothetical protein [Nitrospirota bacterium]
MKYFKLFGKFNFKKYLKSLDLNISFIVLFALIAYLLKNTGIHSDEYLHIKTIGGKDLFNLFLPFGAYKNLVITYYTHFIWYHFMDFNSRMLPWVLKVFYGCLTLYMTNRFFTIFLNNHNALIVSFLYLFYPSHDTAEYSFLCQYLPLTVSTYLYAYYLIYNERLKIGFVVSFIASFLSYASPAIGFGLFILFLLQKEYKKSMIIFMPEIIYVIYYIKFMGGANYTSVKFDLFFIIKQFIIQILSSIDAVIGPSLWLKIYYSFYQLSLVSIVIGVMLTVVYYYYMTIQDKFDKKLLLSMFVMVLTSFTMFSLASSNAINQNFYPQLAFGNGDRTTVYGSLLAAYIIALIPVSKKIQTLFFAIFIFSILGISDHWKDWEKEKQIVITNIANNKDLKNYDDNRPIFFVGHNYSKFGRMSHIEFFAEGWIPEHIMGVIFHRVINTFSIKNRYKYFDGYLIDQKNERKIYAVDGYINVYDTDSNRLFRLYSNDINNYIDSLPNDNRHWIQLIRNKYIDVLIEKLMPSLRYSF